MNESGNLLHLKLENEDWVRSTNSRYFSKTFLQYDDF